MSSADTRPQIGHIERQIADLDHALAAALAEHQDAIERLCELPGVSVRTVQHIVAETGHAPRFSSRQASWPPEWRSVRRGTLGSDANHYCFISCSVCRGNVCQCTKRCPGTNSSEAPLANQ